MIAGISRWLVSGAAAALVAGHGHLAHALDCGAVTAALAPRVQDLRCVDSPDLTTQNPDTTPLDNARTDLPPLAFTPRTDRASVVSDVQRTPIANAVPGLQITGAMADDAGARFVIRLPATGFTGRLIVGVPGSTRSEYTGDFFASDLVVQRGDAYVMSNKGAYNLRLTPATDPEGCALAPPGVPAAQTFVRAYAGDRPHGIEQWFPRTVQSAELARDAIRAAYGGPPHHTYLFGVSAGGLTVRHVLAFTPRGFDGGVDWEGLFVTPRHPTVLREYPGAVAGFLDYRASQYDPAGPGADTTSAGPERREPRTRGGARSIAIASAARGSVTRLLGAEDALGRADAAARVAAECARGADRTAARPAGGRERQHRRHRLGLRRLLRRTLGTAHRADQRAVAADALPERRRARRRRCFHRCCRRARRGARRLGRSGARGKCQSDRRDQDHETRTP